MKSLMLLLAAVFSISSLAGQLDLRKLQYPVDSAKEEAQKPVPRFAAFLDDKTKLPRLPGLDNQQRHMVRTQYNIKILNEYRLYDKAPMDYQEKVVLERYCTRYNRTLLRELGL